MYRVNDTCISVVSHFWNQVFLLHHSLRRKRAKSTSSLCMKLISTLAHRLNQLQLTHLTTDAWKTPSWSGGNKWTLVDTISRNCHILRVTCSDVAVHRRRRLTEAHLFSWSCAAEARFFYLSSEMLSLWWVRWLTLHLPAPSVPIWAHQGRVP
jgi:hypothetical protein